jgi:hypothetical protein
MREWRGLLAIGYWQGSAPNGPHRNGIILFGQSDETLRVRGELSAKAL